MPAMGAVASLPRPEESLNVVPVVSSNSRSSTVRPIDKAPGSPLGPLGPVAPVGPVGPVAPIGPVGPVEPVAPVGPVEPAGPVGPAGPIGPVAPAAQVAPCGPIAPVAPACATRFQSALPPGGGRAEQLPVLQMNDEPPEETASLMA